jgi:hypothetical protein
MKAQKSATRHDITFFSGQKIGQTGVRQTLEDRKNIGNGGGKK